MIVNTNVPALFAENALTNTTNVLNQLEQQLSTGYQINSPADNPAGLAIATLMSGELGGINAAINNANQAVNLLETANGGIQNDVQIVTQIQQLATQASSSTETTQDQQDLQNEINSLLQQLDNNAQSINYNTQVLLNGDYSAKVTSLTTGSTITNITLGADSGNAAAGSYTVVVAYSTSLSEYLVNIINSAGTVATATVNVSSTTNSAVAAQLVAGTSGNSGQTSFVVYFNPLQASTATGYSVAFSVSGASQALTFQVGPQDAPSNEVTANLGQFNSVTLGLQGISVVGVANAQYAIQLANNALSMLTNAQGQIGALQDQLNYTIQNLQTENTNLQAAKSTIMDANMANVMSNFTQEQILQQTGMQALQSADQLPALVLKLLG
ncbi:MAG: flagellin [Firmicutes bacterium]|nr:flagellin [Alicyclobacillaceae bacterium]MCL6497330.1 flagellin [Bacillota bacterium]